MKTILFLGRFEPVTIGHAHVLRSLIDDDEVGMIKIAIGSALDNGNKLNPFTFTEREQMINSVMDELHNPCNKQHIVYAVPDIHNYPLYVDHVNKIVGKYDYIVTGNEIIRDLWEEKLIPVRDLKRKGGISGTIVRDFLAADDDRWEQYVPIEVAQIIKSIEDIQGRLK